ncbi:MAG: hypothetical protein GY711_35180 [bacterium]|nr:hypothetical protein [bacterium]
MRNTPRSETRAPLARLLFAGACALLASCSGGPSQTDATSQIRRDLRHIELGLKQYAGDKGKYPSALSDLVQPGAIYPRTEPRPELPRDPWGNDYLYVAPSGGDRLNLICLGEDAQPGGDGPAADIELAALSRR